MFSVEAHVTKSKHDNSGRQWRTWAFASGGGGGGGGGSLHPRNLCSQRFIL